MNKKTAQIIEIILLLGISAMPPASAIMNESTLYFSNTTPINNIYEKVVLPGHTLALGRTYDLTHVSGVSKAYAWWSDWRIQGTTCTPTTVINTSYILTNGRVNPKNVTLNPSDGWKVGDWYQWDGCFQKPYQKGQIEPGYQPYLSDNNLMFHVIYDPNPPVPEPTITEAPISTTSIPTPTTAIPVPTTAIPEIKDEGWPWWYYGLGTFIAVVIIRILW